uniref:Uncharacterized protein n=1 Tax=Piliocolobus tephrosceles TaxID=591936 RepID=A0A8C9H4E5_9PRIM
MEPTKASRSSPACWLSVLVLCQAGSLQAAPFRSVLESSPDPATVSEEEVRLLLAALVQDYVQMKASELEQEQETAPGEAPQASSTGPPLPAAYQEGGSQEMGENTLARSPVWNRSLWELLLQQ